MRSCNKEGRKLVNKKKKLIKIFLLIISSLLIPILIEKFYFNQQPFSLDRYIIFSIICLFVSTHFIFDYKSIWNQVYKKRYIIGILVFLFLVVNGYHGSSVSIYNGVIQSNSQVENAVPLIGENRTIRSDEWGVTSVSVLSQNSEQNNYSVENKTLMAMEKPVNLYMKLPTKDITVLGNPPMMFFLFLPLEQAFSAYWYFNIFVMFFSTFELLMIMTQKKKIWSFVGAISIVFSPAVQWWGAYNMIGYGSVAVISFYYFLKTDKMRNKIIYSIIIGLAGAVYIMSLYPAWMVPYGYFFLAIVIWMLYDQRGNYKWYDFFVLIPIAVLVISCIIVPAFIDSKEIYALTTQTVYPGSRASSGGYGWQDMFKFFSSIFIPFTDTVNASEMAQFICLYPLPMIVGLYHSLKNYKNKTNDFLLNSLVILSIFLGIWNFIELPDFIAKITMMSMSTVERSNITLGFVNLIIMILCLSKYASNEECKIKKIIIVIIATLFYVILGILINLNMYGGWLSYKKLIPMFLIFCVLVALFLYNHNRTNKILLILLIGINICSGATVHPLNKGLDVIYEKPVSKEIKKIVSNDTDSIWITAFTPFYFQNYVAANGAPILNSTNYVPNFDMWEILDTNNEFRDIYNRYAHISVELTLEKTKIELIAPDHIKLTLNSLNLKDLGIDYILTIENIDEFSTDETKLNCIYDEDGIKIYKVIS